MKKLAIATTLVLSFASVSAYAATWRGTVSDAMCGAKHVNATKADQECAQKCVKGGEPAVFVSDGKVYKIDNQDAVRDHVGHKVTLTGSMNGDTIHVDKVSM
jgi:hypothetical protein